MLPSLLYDMLLLFPNGEIHIRCAYSFPCCFLYDKSWIHQNKKYLLFDTVPDLKNITLTLISNGRGRNPPPLTGNSNTLEWNSPLTLDQSVNLSFSIAILEKRKRRSLSVLVKTKPNTHHHPRKQ